MTYTDDEREAVAKVLRGMLEPISGDPVTNPEWVAAAIVSSEPWRNRHRGPIRPEGISDEMVEAVAQYLRDEGLMPLGWTGETYARAALEAAFSVQEQS